MKIRNLSRLLFCCLFAQVCLCACSQPSTSISMPTATATPAISAAVSQACGGVPIPEAAPLESNPAHSLLLVQFGEQSEPIPEAWQPNITETELIACVYPAVPVLWETCKFLSTSGSFQINRYRYASPIKVVIPRTGETIGVDYAFGGPPQECPRSASSSAADLYGALVSLEADVIPTIEYYAALETPPRVLSSPSDSVLNLDFDNYNTREVDDISFSPDGTLIASTVWQDRFPSKENIRVWDVGTRVLLNEYEGTGEVYHIAFSPDNRLLAVANADWSISLMDLETGLPVRTLQTPESVQDSVRAVVFSPDAKRIIASSGYEWNVETGAASRLFDHPYAEIALPPGSNNLLILAVKDAWSLDLSTGKKSLLMETLPIHDVFALADENTLITWGMGDFSAIDLTTGERRELLPGESVPYYVSYWIDIAASGNFLATIYATGMTDLDYRMVGILEIRDLTTGELLYSCPTWAYSVAFSPDGKTLAWGSLNGDIYMWNVADLPIRP